MCTKLYQNRLGFVEDMTQTFWRVFSIHKVYTHIRGLSALDWKAILLRLVEILPSLVQELPRLRIHYWIGWPWPLNHRSCQCHHFNQLLLLIACLRLVSFKYLYSFRRHTCERMDSRTHTHTQHTRTAEHGDNPKTWCLLHLLVEEA